MTQKEMFDELLELAERVGISVRNEKGYFKSGCCVVNDEKVVIFNRTTSLEVKSAALVRCLLSNNIDEVFVKPAVREYIDKEKKLFPGENDFNLKVDY